MTKKKNLKDDGKNLRIYKKNYKKVPKKSKNTSPSGAESGPCWIASPPLCNHAHHPDDLLDEDDDAPFTLQVHNRALRQSTGTVT
jgi:hypothetical protein